ncbi:MULTISPECIES: potassium channel family protein [unclassified Fibrobacter]|uniref:potassium channel family protein n=1 Tax=unclassified Fibrobacter TaxID=2634177 RepID=UPI0025B8493C|nr:MULTISPECIES: potassium channel family protein [unclassified Fibrobacter]
MMKLVRIVIVLLTVGLAIYIGMGMLEVFPSLSPLPLWLEGIVAFLSLLLGIVLGYGAFNLHNKKQEIISERNEEEVKRRCGGVYDLLNLKSDSSRGIECVDFSNSFGDLFNDDIKFEKRSGQEIANLCKIDEEIHIDNTVIDAGKELVISRKNRVIVKRCIVLGALTIDDNNCNSSILISDCLFFGKLTIRGTTLNNHDCSLSVEKVFADQIDISGVVSNLKMRSVSSGSLNFVMADVKRSDLRMCKFSSLRLVCSSLDFEFNASLALNVKNTLREKLVKKWTPVKLVMVEFQTAKKNYRDVMNLLIDGDQFKSVNDRATLIYYRNKMDLNGFMKFFYVILGGMIEPRFVFVWMFVVLCLFGGIYYFLDDPFVAECINATGNCSRSANGIGESIYFSIITLTTVGYGDLTPCSYARFWASLEGILGILLGGAFLIAVSRKYFDRFNDL